MRRSRWLPLAVLSLSLVFSYLTSSNLLFVSGQTDEFAPLDAATLQKFVDVLPLPPSIVLTYPAPGASTRRSESLLRIRSENEGAEGKETELAEELESRQDVVDEYPDAPGPDEEWTVGKQWEAANGGKVPRSVTARARYVCF